MTKAKEDGKEEKEEKNNDENYRVAATTQNVDEYIAQCTVQRAPKTIPSFGFHSNGQH